MGIRLLLLLHKSCLALGSQPHKARKAAAAAQWEVEPGMEMPPYRKSTKGIYLHPSERLLLMYVYV